jgi:hypothetical protein
MEPFKHVTVLNVDLSRNFFTRQGLRMNNLGEERIAIKIENAVITVLKKNGISVSYKNDAITRGTLKQPRSKSTKKLQLMLQPRKNQ